MEQEMSEDFGDMSYDMECEVEDVSDAGSMVNSVNHAIFESLGMDYQE